MSPAINDGDLVFYYRLDKNCVANDTVIVEYEGQKQVRRVVAIEGDTVDITEDGLEINGALQQEKRIYYETLCYMEGITFPVTLESGQVFVLGDYRVEAVDSRMYGPVETDDILGKVMTVIRRRTF